MSCNKELWGVSTKGNVYTLSTKAHKWQRINNEGQCLRGFKKVASSPLGAWGLGCDQLVYVYITESDVPIRVQVATYENERWMLSRGWGGEYLLPHVDPWQWSNEDGCVHLPKQNFKLPQFWHWESDWMVDENVKGFLTDKGGWRYSNLNFQSEFSHKKTFRSCVRRRRWIRYRRYHATNRWARLPSIHVDPLEEPIMDLAVGGHQMPNQKPGYVAVWIVTINGRVLTRIGVSSQCPEGQSWKEIAAAEEEVLSVSVGAMGLLWTVTWAGALLVRTGISWHNPLGSGWKAVDVPADLEGKDHIVHCAVGVNAVWIASQEGKIWLRKGVSSGSGDISESGACGSGWLRMAHSMKALTVGHQDKVWGIDSEDFHIYFRCGISQQETSGRLWKIMDLPHQVRLRQTSHSLSSLSIVSAASEAEKAATADPFSASAEQLSIGGSLALTDSAEQLDMAGTLALADSAEQLDIGGTLALADSAETLEDMTPSLTQSSAGGSDKSPKKAAGKRWSSKLKSEAASKFYVPLTENETFKRNEKVLHNVFSHIEKNVTDKIEGGLDMGRKVGKDLERKLVKKIPVIKQVTRRNDPNVKLQYSKDDDARTVSSKDRVSLQLTDKHGSQNSLSASSQEKITGSRESLSKTDSSRNSEDETKQTISIHNPPELLDLYKTELLENQLPDKRKGVQFDMEAASKESVDEALADVDSLADSCSYDGVSLTSVEIRELEDDGAWLQYETEADEGELQWAWVSAAALDVQDENIIKHWLIKDPSADSVESLVTRYRVSQAGWRDMVLQELRSRNSTQGEAFSHYELAIKKGVWCKKGSLRWWQDLHRGQKWIDCTVELTQDSDGTNRYASFTLQYQIKGEFKYLQIELAQMTCIYTMTDKSTAVTFAIHTADRLQETPRLPPLRFSAHTEDEMEDWLAALSVGCCEQRCVGTGPPADVSLWAVSHLGDIFVHEAEAAADTELPQQMFWHQLGGHLKVIESNVCGVTWGIGHNGTAYVYTGGYGGGFFKNMATSPHGIHTMSDMHEHYVYENQRWRLLRGYTGRVLMVDHYMWSDESGKKEVTKDGTRLPSVHWHWAGEWTVDRRLAGDKDGWQYAWHSMAGPFSAQPKFRSNLRRRRWLRRSRVTSSGPWSELGPLPLRAVTVQLKDEEDAGGADTPVAVWAVGSNGDVLCRVGVSRKQPRGSAWHHVATDIDFVSISSSLDMKVWAVATDGSAWLRNGITTHSPTGTHWSQVPPPDNSTLLQIAAGCQFVMAVDNNNVLWFRQGICTSVWEGTSWKQVTKHVQQVSIGPRDQVWVILDGVSSKAATLNGVVSRRVGISHDKPKAGAWDHGIGGDWSYICARGWIK